MTDKLLDKICWWIVRKNPSKISDKEYLKTKKIFTGGELCMALRFIFKYPRHPADKAYIWHAMLNWDSVPEWRKYVTTQEIKADMQ